VGPTAWACWLTFAACLAVVGALTRGFEYWTFEGLRQARAELGELRAPPTTTRTSQGETRTLFEGKSSRAVVLVDFVYTTCPYVCQALGSDFQRLQQALDDDPAPGVHLVSLSFDGGRDGQAALAAYANRFRARPERWTVASPLTAELNRQLMQSLGVVAVADGLGGYVHNGDIHLIDGAGVLHGIYSHDGWEAALAAARNLAAVP
jgi:protein SCO1/2